MKFGFRTPSFKRSLSAATKGAAKRALMREIIPYYGKRGMGWSNPKKAAYNHLYSMTTVSPVDLLTNTSSRRARPTRQIPQIDYESKANALSIYKRGLEQIKIPMALLGCIKGDILNDSPMHKSIRQLNTIVTRYLNKSMNGGFDYCDMCEVRLHELKRINPEVKEMCLNIVECIRIGVSADDIFATLSSKKSLNSLINEHQAVDNSVIKAASHKPSFTPIASSSPQYQQSTKKDLQTWEVVLRCIGAVVGFVLLAWLVLWLIAEFVFPAILLGLIFLSFLFAKK